MLRVLRGQEQARAGQLQPQAARGAQLVHGLQLLRSWAAVRCASLSRAGTQDCQASRGAHLERSPVQVLPRIGAHALPALSGLQLPGQAAKSGCSAHRDLGGRYVNTLSKNPFPVTGPSVVV